MPQVELTPEEIAECINLFNYAIDAFDAEDLIYLKGTDALANLKRKFIETARIKPAGTANVVNSTGTTDAELPNDRGSGPVPEATSETV